MKRVASLLLIFAPFALAQHAKQGDIPLNVIMTGAETVSPEIKQAIANEISRTVTEVSKIPDEMSERIRDQFQQYGYFKAQVENPQRKEVRDGGILKRIDLRVHVEEGRRYRVGEISFEHATIFNQSALRQAIPVREGEIFNVEKLRQGLKVLRTLYCSRGYMEFAPVPQTVVDDEQSTIGVTFDMDEGPQFRFGRLILNGLEPHPGDGKRMLEKWKTVEGRIFDCDLAEHLFELDLKAKRQHSVGYLLGKSGSMEISQDHNTKEVNFYYEFPDPK